MLNLVGKKFHTEFGPAGGHILTIFHCVGRINLDEYQVPVYREVLGVGGHGYVCTTVDADQLEVC